MLASAAVIGRDARCELVVADETASRRHCRVEPTPDGGWLLLDLGSSNGTWRNGRRVMRAPLASGDELIVGREVFQVEVRDDEEGPGAAPEPSPLPEAPPSTGWTRVTRLLPRRLR